MRERVSKFLMAGLVFLAASVTAQRGTVTAAADAAAGIQYMSLEDVKPGMKGKGMSVFSGTRPEEFDVEILGVIRNWSPGRDLILGRASGARIEYLGISAGMSGTPVYVDGRLVGAIAFTWSFVKEPLAGITPIGEMLEVSRRAGRAGPDRDAGAPSGSGAGQRASAALPDGSASMKEIGTPIMVAGLHPRVVDMMKEKLAGYNMVVAQSGSGTREDADTLVAGGPLAAQLVSGDAVVSAIGTVTAVNGTRVLGFGHGLFSAGPVEVPMSGAYIHTVLPSLANSLKLGSASRVVGTITEDEDTGVSGEIGRKPDLVPVEVVVDAGAEAETFRYQVVRHKLFTPSLVAWTAASSALTAAGAVGELTVRMNVTLKLEDVESGRDSVRLEHLFFSSSSASPLTEFVSGLVDAVMSNEFEAARLTGVKCELSFVRERRVAQVEEVYVLNDVARPGEDVTVAVKLRPYRGRAFTKHLSVHVPEGLTGERLAFKVCPAPDMEDWKHEFTSRSPSPRSLAQLLGQIERSGRGDVIECVAYVEEREAVVGGETLPSLPESMARVMTDSRRAGGTSQTALGIVSETSWETGYAVGGCMTASVRLGEPEVRR